MIKPGRIPCQVPFCRRTAKADGSPGQEIICGKHFRLADRRQVRRYRRLARFLSRAMERHPDTYGQACRAKIVRRFELSHQLWEAIKRQCIERAAGI